MVRIGQAATDEMHRRGEAVWRNGDPEKHLGPSPQLIPHLWSPLFSTRCGLGRDQGLWRRSAESENDDFWCGGCVSQAGLAVLEETTRD